MRNVDRILAVFYITLWLFFACWVANAEITSPSLPLGEPTDNPIAVMHGSIRDGRVLGDETRAFLNVRFAPYGKSLFYDETILFCGGNDVVSVAQQFDGMTGAIEVRYEKVAHASFERVGCHELISVKHWSGQ